MNPYAAPSSGKVVTFDLMWARDAIPMCKIGNTRNKTLQSSLSVLWSLANHCAAWH